MEKSIDEQKKAEKEFERGIEFLNLKEPYKAEECFKTAYNFMPNKPNYLSYYGMSIVFAGGNPQVGIELCNRAIKMNCFEPNFYLNLGKIYLQIRNREKAIWSLRQGLKLDKDNQEIINALNSIGSRSMPMVSFLPRDNFVNIYLGKLRHFLNEL